VLAGSVLVFLFANLDNGSIGRLVGAHALGYYAFAFLLAYLPAPTITGGVVSNVLLPLYAKLQGQRGE
jgi:O-antigen/teichoic acid export membrane protein